jgi:DNA-binding transcriptional MerR regulator
MARMVPTLTIGELARRTGLSVKRLRFYSNKGLLPPAGRSPSGYRLYSEAHVLRIDLIRTLREAGVGLTDIGKVLRHDLALEAVLALRLEEVETHILGLERVASALRLAIRSGAPERHLRRISMIVRASNEERRAVIAAFYEKVVEGLPAPRQWTEGMIEASSPRFSDPPAPEQIAAWIELESFLDDPTFVACKRASASDFFGAKLDFDTFLDAQHIAMMAVSDARARGVSPSSSEAHAIAQRFIVAMTANTAAKDTAAMLAHMRTKYDPRGARYWELVAVLRNDPSPVVQFDDWRWFGQALAHVPMAA